AARRARGVLDARPGASVVASEAVPSEPAPEAPPLPAEPPPPPPAPPDAIEAVPGAETRDVGAPSAESVPLAPAASPEPDPQERERQERIALCAKLEGLTGEEVLDYLEESRAVWEGMAPQIDPPELDELNARFQRAMEECRRRYDAVAARGDR